MSDPQSPRARGAIRRAGSKLARYADASGVVALHLVRGFLEFSETKLGAFVMLLSPKQAKALARRRRERPREGLRWFTAGESALVETLANLIAPSDATGPGAEQMALLGRSAVETVDRLAAGSPCRQALYARGLLALDHLAKDEYKSAFVELSREHQVHLLQCIDRLHHKWSTPTSLTAKIRNRTVILYHKWSGLFPAVEIFPRLVEDVLQAFYTDPVSWVWLDYDGPPMPQGYPDLLDRRWRASRSGRSEEHTSELQSQSNLVCRLLLEKKKTTNRRHNKKIMSHK